MIPNKRNLNPMAIARAKQNQLNRAAEDKHPESCSYCGGTLFTVAHELRIVPGLEIGAPQDVLCIHGQRHICIACNSTWKKEDKDAEDNSAGGEGQKGGNGTPGNDGGIEIT